MDENEEFIIDPSDEFPSLSIKSTNSPEEGLNTQTGGDCSMDDDIAIIEELESSLWLEEGILREYVREIYSRPREYKCSCALDPDLEEECNICNNDNLMLSMTDMPNIKNIFINEDST
mmetsp:Transcript_6256/g.5379  ORF Transcript_6256/g.5379 Transcript_6256/m.5379 type:complete len:118 (-) Transcript_6256:13-366(-)